MSSIDLWRKGSATITVVLGTHKMNASAETIWRKGSATITVVLEGGMVRISSLIGGEFRVSQADWLVRRARLRDEGWIKGSETSEDEEPSGVHNSSVSPKIAIPRDTVLRRKDGKLYLMTRQEGGWESYAHLVKNEAWVLDRFNVRIGEWAEDEHGEFRPVIKVTHRMVSKPPRPGTKNTG
jgi:hypothetical protein